VDSTLTSNSVRFVPLGGLGEIGMNCMAFEHPEGLVVVDCGVGFPHDDVGVQLEHPDFTWLLQRRDRVRGVFITHGHEDHIGAVPHLLRALDLRLPVFAPPHALELLASRFDEHELETDLLCEATPGGRYSLGPFEIEPVRVSHSIIDATALAIRTPAGLIVHTGDFDMDQGQPAGDPIDGDRFMELGDEGVRLLLSDSTNVDTPERAGSEDTVAEALGRIVQESPGRVVIALFASNIHRMKVLGEAARRSGRRVCLLGRSLVKQHAAAVAVGRLHWPSDLLVAPEVAAQMTPGKLLVLAGGTQAEQGSAMRRLASDSHQHVRLEAGDTVVFSSRIIPGNDLPVLEMVNDLLRLGVRVHTRFSDPAVHTSGHAGRSEQVTMLDWVRPRSFLPVHGTLHHLRRHAEVARECGVEDVAVVENGSPVLIRPGGPLLPEAPVPHGRVRVLWGGQQLDEETRRRRLDLARNGLALVSVQVSDKRRLLRAPSVSTRGVPGVDDERIALNRLRAAAADAVERSRDYRMEGLEEPIRRAVRRELFELTGTRPAVEVHVIEGT
jgi:ribonuclease J